MNYCAGLIFDQTHCLLIEKKRPSWQAGYWNLIGGKVEPNESAHEAMIREAYEEANAENLIWNHKVILTGKDFKVDFFAAKFNGKFLKSKTDERVSWHPLDSLPKEIGRAHV